MEAQRGQMKTDDLKPASAWDIENISTHEENKESASLCLASEAGNSASGK